MATDILEPKNCIVFHENPLRSTVYTKNVANDIRSMFRPFTPHKLTERSDATLDDYLAVVGLLGLKTFVVLRQPSIRRLQLALIRAPKGPTVTYDVVEVATRNTFKHMLDASYAGTAPLVLLNGFSTTDRLHVLQASLWQSLFPPLETGSMASRAVHRVVLVQYVAAVDQVQVRHYFVSRRPAGVSKRVRKLLGKRKVPSLAGREDVAALLQPFAYGGTGGEESSEESEGVPQSSYAESTSIRLIEVGPRLNLSLSTVSDGVLAGDRLYDRATVEEAKEAEEEKQQQQKEKKEKKEKKAKKDSDGVSSKEHPSVVLPTIEPVSISAALAAAKAAKKQTPSGPKVTLETAVVDGALAHTDSSWARKPKAAADAAKAAFIAGGEELSEEGDELFGEGKAVAVPRGTVRRRAEVDSSSDDDSDVPVEAARGLDEDGAVVDGDAFLNDYVRQERWKGTDRSLWTPEHLVDDDATPGWVNGGHSQLFRHAEAGSDAVASFPRSHLLHIQSARAKKPSRHARERANKKARKEAEREAALEDLKAAKNAGKAAIYAAIDAFRKETGNQDISFDNVLAGTAPSNAAIDAAIDHYLGLEADADTARFRYTSVEPVATGNLDALDILNADDERLERIAPLSRIAYTYE